MKSTTIENMRVLFVLPRMWAGGVERVTLNLASAFRTQGIECCLALRSKRGELFIEALEVFSRVEIIGEDGMRYFVPRLADLIKFWQPTHIVSAFTDIGLLTWMARRRAGAPARLIHGIHNTHALVNRRRGVSGLFRFAADDLINRFLYPRVDVLICVSHGIESEVRARYPSAAVRVHTIYNPVASVASIEEFGARAKNRTTSKNESLSIVCLGRLTRQKGFDILIEAASLLPTSLSWHIDIYGEGPERSNLEQLIRQKRLEERVILLGSIQQPHSVLARADLFVLPSRYEGFALVLVEALMHGVQVIAADCPHGPREILDGGRIGQLVPVEDARALTDAITAAMTRSFWIDPEKLASRATQFSIEKSVARWVALLEKGSASDLDDRLS